MSYINFNHLLALEILLHIQACIILDLVENLFYGCTDLINNCIADTAGIQIANRMVSVVFILCILIVVLNKYIGSVLSVNNTEHMCFREEVYTELIKIPVQQQVRIRSSNWCLEIPPRCSNYKTETREVIRLQNVTKTKIIEYCCEGYVEITVGNETLCKPICRGGCGRGVCHTPNECHCDPGYIGRHCTHRCQHGRWGEGCRFLCKCRNEAYCDNRTGKCRCVDGWTGLHCDQPCPDGFYGTMCKMHCECSSKKCDPVRGECILEDELMGDDVAEMDQNQTEANSHSTQLNPNDTSLIIESLNSSIANLTENIDKLAKNLNRTTPSNYVTVIVPNALMEMTTAKTLHEVIVIKPKGVMTSTAVVVPLSPDEQELSAARNTNPMVQKTVNLGTGRVIEHLQKQLDFVNNNSSSSSSSNNGLGSNETFIFRDNIGDGVNAVLIVIAIFSLAILACSVGFLVLYRRHLMNNQDETRNKKIENDLRRKENVKVLTKPLPDLPAFTQNITRRSYVPEFYDRPSNKPALKINSPESKYSGVSSDYSVRPFPNPYPRKGSVEHLYDEINYNMKSECSRV